MLCATTKWKYASLGAKYLRVVKHALYIPPTSPDRSGQTEDIDIIAVITMALSEIL
jgi:hypothetical protein